MSHAAPRLFDVCEKTIEELQSAQARGEVNSRSLVAAYLERIAAYDQAGPALNAIVALSPDALEQADRLDRERAATGPRGPLHGIPILVKDNYDTADMPTSGGTLALATLRPQRDAALVRKLREAGAVILGKTTLHELAAGITTTSSLTGVTRNPYHLERVPGGSSGGSGAAVAASFAAAALGTDTCGSIRIPAANQNLVGLRSSFGLSSRAGVMPLSWSQDVSGPLARCVEDLAVLLDATMGEDSEDRATVGAAVHIPPSYRAALKPGILASLRIGVLEAFFGTTPDEIEVSDTVRAALRAMEAEGATLVPVALPDMDRLLAGSSAIAHEFKFDLADYLAARPSAPVHSLGQILALGLHHQALDHALRLRDEPTERDTPASRDAAALRQTLRDTVLGLFDAERLEVIVHPTLRRLPARIGDAQPGHTCQLSASTGFPAISFPAGFSADGVPIGMEFLGRAYAETLLLNCAYDWERLGMRRRAPFSTPPLVNSVAPLPKMAVLQLGAELSLGYDAVTGILTCDFDAQTIPAGSIAITLHRARGETVGPVIGHLWRSGQRTGRVQLPLSAVDRHALAAGELYVQRVDQVHPLGAGRQVLRLD
jgi:amidase